MGQEELLERAKAGEVEAFEILTSEHQKYIYNVILKIVFDKEEALDLTQETLLKAYLNIKKFKGNSSFRTWLYRIAINCAIDYLRKRNVERSNFRKIEEFENEVKDFETPEEVVDKKLTAEIVMKEINKLPLDYKVVLILRDIEGLNYEEISKIMNLNLGTVKSRLWRARNLLKERIKSLPEFLSLDERRQV
ncbi:MULTISPECIES: sigma-70 family RNA polymerase sigma factor [Thermoanaerobacter]|uniref:RNA polymerase sigma factor n=1 Tax=Thermoanaerobacter uzonensis DSM 18761 TaxID=1123369 RepID=A0A1M4Z1V3_9THEO|nr:MULTISPECIES: sigma-70 family RNA polymerase sigma factor [Thermoanaerobacter]SHF12049.1 RNA polymerase, sigma-24 subunit, RpoE [Thermoanaerobacter uzonensis DSM 18761]